MLSQRSAVFLGQWMENCDATTENNPQILVVDIRFFFSGNLNWLAVGFEIIGPPKWISTKYDQRSSKFPEKRCIFFAEESLPLILPMRLTISSLLFGAPNHRVYLR